MWLAQDLHEFLIEFLRLSASYAWWEIQIETDSCCSNCLKKQTDLRSLRDTYRSSSSTITVYCSPSDRP